MVQKTAKGGSKSPSFELLTRPHYSTKTCWNYLSYIERNFPQVDLKKMLLEIGLSYDYLKNENAWVSLYFFDQFYRRLVELTGEENLAFSAGRQAPSPESLGKFVYHFARQAVPTRFYYEHIPTFGNLYTKVTRFEVKEKRRGFLRLGIAPLVDGLSDGDIEILKRNWPHILSNTIGFLTGIAQQEDLPVPHIQVDRNLNDESFVEYDINITYQERNQVWLPGGVAAALGAVAAYFFWSSLSISGLYAVGLGISVSSIWMTIIFWIRLKGGESKLLSALDSLRRLDSLYVDLERKKEEIEAVRDSYARFVPFQILDIMNVDDIVALNFGQHKEISASIMFCDIQGYSTRAEKLSPTESMALVNSLFNLATPLIRDHHGFVDKFMGDGFLAVFPQSAADAVRTALDLTHAVETQKILGMVPEDLQIGFGISTGLVSLTTLGAANQMQVSVISDAVNVAARLQDMTRHLPVGILFEESTFKKMSGEIPAQILSLGSVLVKGRAREVGIYSAVSNGDMERVILELQEKLPKDINDKGLQEKSEALCRVFQERLRMVGGVERS
jgi:class 3 adenylate cyclase